MNISVLNKLYGLDGQLDFIESNTGFPLLKITNRHASAVISLYGGQVLSFKPANIAEDLLFLSNMAIYQPGKAIRGGIPICWPWFGNDPEELGRPAHGFARTSMWTVKSIDTSEAGDTLVTLGLSSQADSLEIWPYKFELELEVCVASDLRLSLTTRNVDEKYFLVTQALHTYFHVGDISQVYISGMENCDYIDKTNQGGIFNQDNDITVDDEVDRIYLKTPSEQVISDGSFNRKMRISTNNSYTTVVWNPWVDIALKMTDLNDDDFRRFVCVETANVESDCIRVDPAGSYTVSAIYRLG